MKPKTFKRPRGGKLQIFKNPIGGAMKAIDKVTSAVLPKELQSLKSAAIYAGAGATFGALEALAQKHIWSRVVTQVPQLAPVLTMAGGIITTAVLRAGLQKVKSEEARKLGDALVLFSVMKAASDILGGTVRGALGMSGIVYAPLSGVKYTPTMRGIPEGLRGVDFTPMKGVPRLNTSTMGRQSADFGAYNTADFGQGGGYSESMKSSPADFGAMDEEHDEVMSDNLVDQLGGMA